MTTAPHPLRWRRVLVLIAASVLLHYAAIGWVEQGLGKAGGTAPRSEPETIVASLYSAAAVPAPVKVPAQALSAPSTPAAEPEARAPEGVAQVQFVAPAEPAAPLAEAAPQAAAPAAEAAPVAEALASPVPGYAVNLPPPAVLRLDVERTDASGTQWSGQALMEWSRSGEAYRMTVAASLRVLVAINLVELTSEGTVGQRGIVPRTMTEKRRSKAQTATHFDAQQGRITFSASQASFPMAPGTQDKATFPIQLAGIARADPAQLGSGVEILVGEERDATLFRFELHGQEEIDTPLGRLATWRITRPPRPGSYTSRVDVWLAPGHEWYPVRIRSTEANGAVTTQTIREIVVKEAGT